MPSLRVAKTFLEIAYQQREERIVRQLAAGLTQDEIAKLEHLTRQRVQQILRKVRLQQARIAGKPDGE